MSEAPHDLPEGLNSVIVLDQDGLGLRHLHADLPVQPRLFESAQPAVAEAGPEASRVQEASGVMG
ncbi:hypothetical protein [Leisingera thetidis]|uniref:hypothetical protein n=1 Tax=Leisingera thetidis TaxID=2930199 RepID=UPI0033131569